MFYLTNYLRMCTKLHKIESGFIKQIIQQRKFQTSSTVCEKHFVNHENIFAHKVLQSNEKCSVLRGEQLIDDNIKCVDINLKQNWRKFNTSDILVQLKMIGSYCRNEGLVISDERFDEFVDVCAERCFDFTDDELINSLRILSTFPETKSPNSRNFVELWKALDHACVERLDKWDYNKIFYVCDHWHMLNLAKTNKFNLRGNLKIGKKLRKLPPHQLVQTMFNLNLIRKPILEMFEIETNLMKSIDELSLNEIAVVCMGFFKTETKVKNPDLVNLLYQRLIREMQTVQNIPLVCILKTLRYSSNVTHVDSIKQLFDAAQDQIYRLSTLSCLHLALQGTHTQICHQKCIEQIVHRFADDIKSLRVKDFERIAFVLGLFDFKSESGIENKLCQDMLVELKNRTKEITKHPKCFALCLNYLLMKGYYDEEMISTVLSQPFLKLGYTDFRRYGREIFGLDAYAKINLKETYQGNVLLEKARQFMGKMFVQYVPVRGGVYKLSATDKILLEVKETSQESYKHCYFAHTLPHFDRPDVIIAYDKNAESGIDIESKLPELYRGQIIDRSMLVEGLRINLAEVEIINIIIGGWNNYVRDTHTLNGLIKLKMEQSKILGIVPVLIHWFDWTRLLPEERKYYLKLKITNALQQK